MPEYSPYSNGAVDAYMDEALACTDLEASYELWKKAQWDGGTGITQEGDLPWIWLVNIDHLYWVKGRAPGGGAEASSPRPWLVHRQ